MILQSLSARQRAFIKVLLTLIAAVSFAIAAIGGAGLVSLSAATRASVHSILASWAAIPLVVGLLLLKRKSVYKGALLNIVFVIPFLIHIEGGMNALISFYGTDVIIQPWNSTGMMLEYSLIGVFIASSIFVSKRETNAKSNSIVIAILAISIPVVLHGLIWYLVFPAVSPLILSTLTLAFGLIGAISLVFSSATIFTHNLKEFRFDRGWFTSGCILLLASIILLFILPQDTGWIYAENMEMAAFFIFALSAGVPYLRRKGFSRFISYFAVLALLIAAYIPLLTTVTIETNLLTGIISDPNTLAHSIIQISAVFLASMMAYLLYSFSVRNPSWQHYPLILILCLWASESAIAIVSASSSIISETIIPYLVGNILTLFLIALTIRWTDHPYRSEPPKRLPVGIALAVSVMLILILLGVFGNQIIVAQFPHLVTNHLGPALLLFTNLVVMSAFAFLLFFLIDKTKGKMTTEIYIAAFLSMWTIPNILLCFYAQWTAGWWISQILGFAGLLVGPAILARLYVGAIKDTTESKLRATLYADLLMHDQTNYNQIALTALELLMFQELSEEERGSLTEDAHEAIVMSDQLIGNVRLLSDAERLSNEPLTPMELVTSIAITLDEITQRIGKEKERIHLKADRPAYVLANGLLASTMYRLLLSTLEESQDGCAEVEVDLISQDGSQFWQVCICIPMDSGITKRRARLRKEHGITGSEGITLEAAKAVISTYGGDVSIQHSSDTDGRILRKVFVRIPAFHAV